MISLFSLFTVSTIGNRENDHNMVLSIAVFINSRVLKKAAVSTDQINGVNRAIYEKKSTRVLHNRDFPLK